MDAMIAGMPDAQEPTDAVQTLFTLHTSSVDAMQGYVRMVEKAEPAFRPVAERYRALHARHTDVLAGVISDMGHDVNPDGSFMGTVNKLVVSMRAFFDDIDSDLMDSIRNGEDYVLEAFDEAIAAPLPVSLTTDLRRMRAELATLLAETAPAA